MPLLGKVYRRQDYELRHQNDGQRLGTKQRSDPDRQHHAVPIRKPAPRIVLQRDSQNGFGMRQALLVIIALLVCFRPDGVSAQDAGPPPLSFDAPPLTPQQQAELVKYRLYLSAFIGSKIDLAKVRALVKEGGDLLQVRSVKFKIRISPSGRLTSRHISMSCGYGPLDTLFLETLDRSGPFNSPPSFAIFQPQDIDVTFAIVDAAL